MPWSKASPGHYQRPIGENEKFIKAIGDRAHAAGREHWSITSKGSFKLTEPLKAVDYPQSCVVHGRLCVMSILVLLQQQREKH